MYFTFHSIQRNSSETCTTQKHRHASLGCKLPPPPPPYCCCCRAFRSSSLSKRQKFKQTSLTTTKKKMEFLNLLGARCFSCDTFIRMRHWLGVRATIACFVTRDNSSIFCLFPFSSLLAYNTSTQLIILLLFHFACYRPRRASTDEAGSSAVVSTIFPYSNFFVVENVSKHVICHVTATINMPSEIV